MLAAKLRPLALVAALVATVLVAAPPQRAAAAPPTAGDFGYVALPAQFMPYEIQDDGSALSFATVWRHGATTTIQEPVRAGWTWSSDRYSLLPDGTLYGAGYFYREDPSGIGGDYDYGYARWSPDAYASAPVTAELANADTTGVHESLGSVNDLGQQARGVRVPAHDGYAELTGPGGANPVVVPGVVSIPALGDTAFIGYDTDLRPHLHSLGTFAQIPTDFAPEVLSANGWSSGTRADKTYALRSPTGVETTIPMEPTGLDDDGDAVGRIGGDGYYLAHGETAPVALASLLPPAATSGWNHVTLPGISPSGLLCGYLTNGDHNIGRGFELVPGAGQLTVSGIALDPPHPQVSDPSVTATVSVRNDFSTAVTAVVPTLTSSDPATLAVASGPTPGSTATLAAGATATFTYALTPKKPQSVTLTSTASAKRSDGSATTSKPTTLSVDLSDGDLTIAVAADPKEGTTGKAETVTATLTNKTDRTLTALTPALATSPSKDVGAGPPSPATIASLDPHGTATVTWQVTAGAPASYALKVSVSLVDPATGRETDVGTGTVVVTAPAIVVTTTGDQADPAAALADDRCDVDPATDGDQCSLRAALQLANQRRDAEKITFDLGDDPAAIVPASALPTSTSPLTLDGTSVTGGVDLRGTALPGGANGLVLAGGSSTVRGLVLRGFGGRAVSYVGGTGNVLAASVLGERVTGDTTGFRNGVDVYVAHASALIGGPGDTSDCSGDCVVLSGSTVAAVDVEAGGSVTVQGDVVGATGGTDDDPGIHPNAAGVVGGAHGGSCGSVVVGGATSRYGAYPGNVVAGSDGAGVQLTGCSDATIQGNLIGVRSDGSVFGNRTAGVALEDVGRATVGGPDARQGNVISGSRGAGDDTGRGVAVVGADAAHPVDVENDRIGTNPAGTVGGRYGNRIGVDGATSVKHSLVSANVDIGIQGGLVIQANLVGTDVTGESILGNGLGIISHGLVGGERPAGDRACDGPCNVISGNREAVALFGGTGDRAALEGNFIGTDRTGIGALPNAGGHAAVTSTAAFVGGFDMAVDGVCDGACNLIAGNAELGVFAAGGRVLGNVIGLGVDGRPLGNARGIELEGGAGPYASVYVDHNRIAGNTGAGATIAAARGAKLYQNAIFGNGGGNVVERGVFTGEYAAASSPVPGDLTAVREGDQVELRGVVPAMVLRGVKAARIDLYASAGCSPGPAAERPMGSVQVGLGDVGQLTAILSRVPAGAAFVTVTETDFGPTDDAVADGPSDGSYSTSVLSRCVVVVPGRITATAVTAEPVVAPGSDVTVDGGGFTPGGQVDVDLHSRVVHEATTGADAYGSLDVVVHVPSDIEPGVHHVVLTGRDGRVASVAITVVAPGRTGGGGLPATGADVWSQVRLALGLLATGVVGVTGGTALRRRRARSPAAT